MKKVYANVIAQVELIMEINPHTPNMVTVYEFDNALKDAIEKRQWTNVSQVRVSCIRHE